MAETLHQDPIAGLRALLLAQTDEHLGPLKDENVGLWPSTGLLGKLDYVSIDLIDGGQDYFGGRYFMQVDVFSETRAEAKTIAGAISLLLLRYPQSVPLDSQVFQIDWANCFQAPHPAEWEDTKIRRESARYEISVRR